MKVAGVTAVLGEMDAGSEKFPVSPFSGTSIFCSVKFLTVKNENF